MIAVLIGAGCALAGVAVGWLLGYAEGTRRD